MINLILAASLAIPHNFLLMEPAARKPLDEVDRQEMGYTISDKLNQPLILNPCMRRKPADRGRDAVRSVDLWTSAPSGATEQLVLYRSVTAAHAAYRQLRADAVRCHRKVEPDPPTRPVTRVWRATRVKVGDESTGLGYEAFQNGLSNGRLSGVVTRRGRALMIYTQFEYTDKRGYLTNQARKMVAKVCRIPGVC